MHFTSTFNALWILIILCEMAKTSCKILLKCNENGWKVHYSACVRVLCLYLHDLLCSTMTALPIGGEPFGGATLQMGKINHHLYTWILCRSPNLWSNLLEKVRRTLTFLAFHKQNRITQEGIFINIIGLHYNGMVQEDASIKGMGLWTVLLWIVLYLLLFITSCWLRYFAQTALHFYLQVKLM